MGSLEISPLLRAHLAGEPLLPETDLAALHAEFAAWEQAHYDAARAAQPKRTTAPLPPLPESDEDEDEDEYKPHK